MSVLGLPLHPLVVHIVVVLLPLGAVSMAMAVLWRAWATRFAAASVGLLTVSGAALLLARSSGEALAGDVGTPVAHVAWADRLTPVAIARGV
ncbi:MAG: hypothetical protein Q4G43_03395, partial [Mobilicoccus sp.]|nr:hypothetical protein [Mobilicoccus sp.]